MFEAGALKELELSFEKPQDGLVEETLELMWTTLSCL